MPSANTVFAIQFGPYDLRLDRSDLTISLTDPAAGVIWADRLSVGWIEVEPFGRVEFGQCRVVSISEKMGATGKRILLGLEAPGGIPVDVYFTCGPKSIQLTVEASRDTREGRVGSIGLFPGLVGTGSNGILVLPAGCGGLLSAAGSVAEHGGTPPRTDSTLAIAFDVAAPASSNGLFGAFVGALRTSADARSSGLCLLHDSVYANAMLEGTADGEWTADWVFRRDPQRRRIDLRLFVIPDADPIAIARAFRDHRVAERSHVTLRQKGRERPGALERVLDGAYPPLLPLPRALDAASPEPRWDILDQEQDRLRDAAQATDCPLSSGFPGEWTAPWVDAWPVFPWDVAPVFGDRAPGWTSFPLLATIWRDAVAVPLDIRDANDFRAGLRLLAPPAPGSAEPWATWLRALHRAHFAAFLTGFRRLDDGVWGSPGCEEWIWSDRTRFWIHGGRAEVVIGDGRSLKPGTWLVDPPVEGMPSSGSL